LACSFCKSDTHDKRGCESPKGQIARLESRIQELDADELTFRMRYNMTPDVQRLYDKRRQELKAEISQLRSADAAAQSTP
jgi:hypothetical protein